MLVSIAPIVAYAQQVLYFCLLISGSIESPVVAFVFPLGSKDEGTEVSPKRPPLTFFLTIGAVKSSWIKPLLYISSLASLFVALSSATTSISLLVDISFSLSSFLCSSSFISDELAGFSTILSSSFLFSESLSTSDSVAAFSLISFS